ncbi:alpha/beta fold hydrolase [Streptomyces sp. NPDC056061]|uniref:alpha/beta fold hydrolase n=1 Tax=Streptomyces sp. NPDC056061 TaxID=3345700 RepID=UPI0035E05AC1
MPPSPLPAPRTRIAGRRRGRTVAAALATAALVAVAVPAAADTDTGADPAGTRPTVVLVHGAFADAAGWKGVAERLRGDGYEVMTPDNPLRGLAADSAHLAEVLKGVRGPIVLAGHSYGGAVISNAAAANPRVKALVFVSAFMPDKGESLSELGTRFTGSELNAALKPVPVKNADGTEGTDLYIRDDRIHEVYAADLPTDTAAPTTAARRPLGGAALMDRATAAAWRSIPSWALVATRDKAIAPDLERFQAKRAKAHTVEVDSSHAVMASHPDAVADLVRQAAGGSSDTSSMASTGISTLIVAGLGGLAVLTVLTGAGILAASHRRRITGGGTGPLI